MQHCGPNTAAGTLPLLLTLLVASSTTYARDRPEHPLLSCRDTVTHLPRLIQRAYRRADLAPRRAVGWRIRLRWSALLPTVSARIGQSLGEGEFLDQRADRTTALDLRNHATVRWEVRASWDLDRLLFDARELRVAGVTRALERERRALAERITRLCFRCQTLAEQLRNTTDNAAQLRIQLRETLALLAALAGPEPD